MAEIKTPIEAAGGSSRDRPFRRLLKQSGLYALGNVAIKLSGLLLAPFYLDTTYLSLVEYGQFAVLLVFAQICVILVGFGFGTGMLKYVGKSAATEDAQNVPFTALAITAGLAGIAIAIFWRFSPSIAPVLIDGTAQHVIVRYLGLYIAFKVVASVPMMMLRIRERAGYYTLAIVLEMIGLIGGVYFFLVVKGEGLLGVVLAYALSAGLSMAVLVLAMLRIVRWQISSALIRPLFVYGSPLVFMGLAGLVLNAGDRFILKQLTTAETVGMYEWAARLSGVLNLFVVQSFQLAFTIIGLKSLGDGQKNFHQRAFRHYSVWAGWAVLGISLLAYDVTSLLNRIGADEHYLRSAALVFPLAIGSMIYGVYVIINNVLFATEKTGLIMWNVLISAGLNILLNYALIPFWGAMGAAVATVASYGVLALLSNRIAVRALHIGYSWPRLFMLLAVVSILFGIGQLTNSFSTGWRLAGRLLLVASYLPLLFILKAYSIDEVKHGWNLVKQRLGKTS